MAPYLSHTSQLSLTVYIASNVAWTISNTSVSTIIAHSAPALLSMATAWYFGTLNKPALGSLALHSAGVKAVSIAAYKTMQFLGITNDLELEQCIEKSSPFSPCGLAKVFVDNMPMAIITTHSFNILGDISVSSISSSVKYAIMHGPAVAAVGVPATLFATYLAQSTTGWSQGDQLYDINSAILGISRYTLKYGAYAMLGVATLPWPQKVLATVIVGGLAQSIIHNKAIFSWNECQTDELLFEFSMGATNSVIYAVGATALMNIVNTAGHPLMHKIVGDYFVPLLAESAEGAFRELRKYAHSTMTQSSNDTMPDVSQHSIMHDDLCLNELWKHTHSTALMRTDDAVLLETQHSIIHILDNNTDTLY